MKTDEWAGPLPQSGIGIVGEIPWGTHFCHFYETKDDLLDILIPYFKAGLEDHEYCMWIIFDPLDETEARNALRRGIPDADRRLAAGDIEIGSHSQWYLKDGKFELDRVLSGWKERLAQALAKGYTGLRVNGNVDWLTEKDWKNFLEYERKVNEVIMAQKMIILCTYPLAKCRATELFDVARAHEFALARRHGTWEVLETPELKEAKAAIRKLNEDLEQRIVDRTRALAAANQDLKLEIAERKEIENKLLASRERLRALSARLESLREEERMRLAREIHDELGQTLTGLKMDLEWMERKLVELASAPATHPLLDRVVAATEVVDAVIVAVQQIAVELRPGVLDKLGLGPALQYEARRFQERTGIACEVRLSNFETTLSVELATALFRIFQESLTNVARHARARVVEVELQVENDSVILSIQDDGRGITEAAIAGPESLGLLGMKERAELLGGKIVFQSNPDRHGTIVTVRIPLTGASRPMGDPSHAVVDR